MTNKEMFKDVDLPSLAIRMYNVMKNAKSVTKETARGGVPYKIVTHNEVNNTIKTEMIKQGLLQFLLCLIIQEKVTLQWCL